MAGRIRISRAALQGWLETLEGKTAVSATLHLLVLLAVANAWWIGARTLRAPGTASGSHVLLAYDTPKAAATVRAVHRAPIHKVRPPKSPVEAPAQIPELEEAVASGSDQALGSGEVSIVFVRPFPSQKPDLEGTASTGDIRLDVQIDETGHIALIHARKGMKDSIDRMVIATVEQWVFQPAMRNGHPVSSSEELHFHYDRARNSAGCGWECFTLEAQ